MRFAQSKWMLLLLGIFLQLSVVAQTKTVTGTVLDEATGSPLVGATVSVKGSTTATVTNDAGQFSIQAASNNILVVSYAGYTDKEVVVGNHETLAITLTSAASSKLDEVVVVGYGTQSRRAVTNSISKLDNQVLANAPRANVGSALQGNIPGLTVTNITGSPGANPILTLRGGASINTPGQPLVVVDGVIRPYNDIATDDIASIDVLKDASATAIYGARANNGVILITTKQGKAGKAEISYKFTQGYNARRPGYNYLNAQDYIYYNRLGNLNSQRTLAQVNSSRGYGLLTSVADLASFDIRKLDNTNRILLTKGWQVMADPYNADGAGRTDSIIFKDHKSEIENLLFRNTQTKDHYVSAMGGNDKGRYFSSFDYYKEDGIIVGSSYKRFTGNINGSYKVRPNIEVSSGGNFSTASQYGASTAESNLLYRSLALWPTFNPWIDSAKTIPNPGVGIADGNPLYWLDKMKRTYNENRITGDAAVKWDLTRDLYLKASGSVYMYEKQQDFFQLPTQLYTNYFAVPPTFSSSSRDAWTYFKRDVQQQYNLIANYTKSFGLHNVGAMLGTEYYGVKTFEMRIWGQNSPTNDIPTANASTLFPSGKPIGDDNNYNYTQRSQLALVSTFGRLNYDFDGRYLFQAVFRNDVASNLPTNNRSGFFPGLSAGWNVHREAFFQNSSLSNIISTLKPRISYGVNGNINGLGRYEVQGIYSSPGTYNGNGGISFTGLLNPYLRWEKSTTKDIGLDLGLFKDRINFIFDYYNRITSDLLTNLVTPSYTGFNTFRTNLGSLQNKGVEMAVNARIVDAPNGLKITAGANASYVKNKVVKLPYNGQANNRQGGIQVWDPNTKSVIWVGGIQEGQPLGEIYGFKQLGIFKDAADVAANAGNRYDAVANITGPNRTGGAGKITLGDVNWLDVDKNDTINGLDRIRLGNIYPKWTGGFNTTVSYKGISLYTRFDFTLGHTIYNDLIARTLGNYQGTFNYTDLQKQSWTPDNPNTNIPKVYYADQVGAPIGKQNYTRINNANANLNSNNSLLYEKGDYLALREIALSYSFSKSILEKTRIISMARIFLSGNNLAYFTKFSGSSPEPPTQSDGTVTGVYLGTYPTPRSFAAGIQLTF